jgi:hypothetical protein
MSTLLIENKPMTKAEMKDPVQLTLVVFGDNNCGELPVPPYIPSWILNAVPT